MYCLHCHEKTNPMGDTCEHCGEVLSDVNPEFISKLRSWLDDRVETGEISRVKAMLLVHLATKPVREVTIMDGWPKQPKNTKTAANEDTLDFSAGEVRKVPDSEIHFSFLDVPLPYAFSWREYMDDPYVRIVLRSDVSILEQNVIWEKLMEIMQLVGEENDNLSRSETRNIDDLPDEEKQLHRRFSLPPFPSDSTETNEIGDFHAVAARRHKKSATLGELYMEKKPFFNLAHTLQLKNVDRGGFYSIDFSADGKLLATGGIYDIPINPRDIGVRIWDTTNYDMLPQVWRGTSAFCIKFSPTNSNLLAFRDESEVILWNMTADQKRVLEGHKGRIECISFSSKDDLLASGGRDGTVRLWHLQTNETLVLTGHRPYECWAGSGVFSLAFSPDGRWLASGGSDDTVRFWDVKTGKEQFVFTLKGSPTGIFDISFNSDGRLVALGTENTIEVWDIDKRSRHILYELGPYYPTRVAFNPDGQLLVGGINWQGKSEIRLWHIADIVEENEGYILESFDGYDGIKGFAFSPDGRVLVSAHGTEAKLWEIC